MVLPQADYQPTITVDYGFFMGPKIIISKDTKKQRIIFELST